MPSRHHASSGYCGVRERPSGTYYVEIRSGDVHVGLDTFETAHEAARAYDTAAWRLGRPRAQMNFHNVYTREQAQALAPPPRLIMEQDRAEHRQQQQRLLVAEEDERAMAEWRHATRRTSPPRTPFGRRERQGVARSGRTGVGARTSEPWRSGADATRRTSPPRTPSGQRRRQGVARSCRTGVGASYSLYHSVWPQQR
ncbi:putative AP2 protein [Hordeum vulgare]|uniref:ethylene-responsive transcription factor RAP2-3-like n=1 Tax=Hordeum vulgare subsp. vulgare TaxID=112509 RepID=UPI001D1A5315|nr:ethylene-responsive transcription factor RAP2-3-like [Hordeum vulgare subsp. vulgare]KAE8806660.1 putative AP2 protein [Hordeum vulgare]